MTDRLTGLFVTLKAIREDDAEPIIAAIRQLRGVLSVDKRVADPDFYVALVRAKSDLREKIFKVLE